MRLIAITDLHGSRAMLERILDDAGAGDAIVLGGDLTDFGTPDDAQALVQLAAARCPNVLAVAGNCDSPAIDRRLMEMGVSIFGRGVVLDDVGFLGVSAMPPWKGTMYELGEEAIASALDDGYQHVRSAAIVTVVSHAPPRLTTVDRVQSGVHVGSTALRAFVDRIQPPLVVCGHIHEARGADRLGRTQIVNCGLARRGFYAVVDIRPPIAVELRQVR